MRNTKHRWRLGVAAAWAGVVVGLTVCPAVGAEEPRGGGRVYHVAQTDGADDEHSGTAEAPLRTINRAAQLARAGDTVLVHEGIYREWVRPARGGTSAERMITYRAAPGEKVYLRGSEVFNPKWTPVMPDKAKLADFVRADLPADLFEPNPRLKGPDGKPVIYNPFATPVFVGPYLSPAERFRPRDPKRADFPRLVLGQVFLRGTPLRQVHTLAAVRANKGTWCALNGGQAVAVHFPRWSKSHVELSVRHQVFAPVRRGLGYIRVQGFVIEHAANQAPFPQAGMLSVRSGHHWVIEDNVIRFAATAGLDVGSEVVAHWKQLRQGDIDEGPWATPEAQPVYETKAPGGLTEAHNYVNAPSPSRGHVIRNNVVSDNGLSGLIAVKADGLLIENNVFERNNRAALTPHTREDLRWFENAGIKLHITRGTRIVGNLSRDNYGSAAGIWLDNSNESARVSRNLIINNYHGINLEINAGPPLLIDNNIVLFNRADGLSSYDSVTVRFVHNLSAYNGRWGCLVDYSGTRGVYFGRAFTWPKNCEVRNNVFLGNQQGAIRFPLPTDAAMRKANHVADNVVAPRDVFQVSPRGRKDFTLEQMIAFVKQALASANVPAELYPDFAAWHHADEWTLGHCGLRAFDTLIGGSNRAVALEPVRIMDAWDAFRFCQPDHYPNRQGFDELSPRYELLFTDKRWSDIRVPRIADVKCDYLSRPMPLAKTVRPGPFQAASDLTSDRLVIWPQRPPPPK